MKRLEILLHVDASNNIDDLKEIGHLLQLRKLGVILDGKKHSGLARLFQQIKKLHSCLHSLSIQINQLVPGKGPDPKTMQMLDLVSPPKFLQSLNISGITIGLDWISKLDQLTKLTLSKTYLGEDVIRVLGKLRILCCLRLRRKSYTGTELNFNTEEFLNLNIDFVNIGAAPKLEMIVWSFAFIDHNLPVSRAAHLPKLKKLELNGDGDMDRMRQEMEAHPNRPVFTHNPSHQRQDAGTS
uniref:Disease resistance R13L4/SHOC-2-like LRR domain-containing protein n=1 Tax=Leersia perrieri TaxID=77586 RepID=A0A0D9XUV7_9ORYZ